ncbi:hypothetical protein FQN54_004188 [Arachnomyces sp. PD_36]|nr:hypothetical protein FQN54_004188 [Arachnomyces sp. PD_36]
MANNSLAPKSKLAGPGSSLRITPSNSPILKPAARPPNKLSSHQSALSLQTVIGTTTSTPNGFSSHEPSNSFALCAGSAAILVELDSDLNISQRFFRARPMATGLNTVPSFYNNSSTPPVTPDTRNRPLPSSRSANGSIYLGSPATESADGGRSWTSRERIKAVTSISISPNGRFLAVGETGYNPRVLIFSTAKDSLLDVPLSILSEHTFGVRSLAFSPNSQYLATLGDVNDGFLFIWAVNLKTGSAKLHSTNKCTSFVRDMCWMGLNLITVGIRHVKVWRLGDGSPSSPSKTQKFNLDAHLSSPNPAPRALAGRNCLLGSLNDNTFTCISSISDCEAIVCCDTGAVCLIDDTDGQQKLQLLQNVGFSVSSISVDFDSGTLWLGGRNKIIRKYSIEELKSSLTSSPSPSVPQERDTPSPKVRKKPAIISMALFSSHMVTVDATRAICISSRELLDQSESSECDFEEVSMPAHRDAVLGVGALKLPNTHDANFFTWSCGGTVSFWNIQGKCRMTKKIELEQPASGDDEASNELKILRTTDDMEFFISGDRYGVIRLIDAEPWKCANEVRAHGGEVTDIAIQSSPELCLVATSGRDRMVQLFKKEESSLQLIQTLDDHVGAVGGLLFMNDGEKMLSCSADRTVIIRERLTRDIDGNTTIAFFLSKCITLKASPISMALAPDDPDTLVLSTIDRNIQRFNVPSGRHIHSFRASDPETNDTVVMSSLIVAGDIPGQSPRLLIGVSTTDKSIRVYDFEKDVLLTREFGHTEGVSDALLLETESSNSTSGVQRTLISTGLDGVVMIWGLSISPQPQQEPTPARAEDATPAKELTAAKPPLRRILSRSEIAELRGQDTPAASPTPIREQSPPRLRKRTSRFGLGPLLSRSNSNLNGSGNTPSPNAQIPGSRRSPTTNTPLESKGVRERSPSPQSPKASKTVTNSSSISNLRRPSIDIRSRTKSNGASNGNSEFGSLNMSTEQVCRTLRAYRKKLNGSTDRLNAASELERELDLTVRALGDRSKKMQANGASQVNGNCGSVKEINEKRPPIPPMPSKPTKVKPRRIPSTPNLGQRVPSSKVPRPRSLDADGEG